MKKVFKYLYLTVFVLAIIAILFCSTALVVSHETETSQKIMGGVYGFVLGCIAAFCFLGFNMPLFDYFEIDMVGED